MQNVHFSPPDLAPLFGVNVSTIKRWIDAGLLESEVTPGGHRRVSREQLQAFVRRSPHLAGSSYVLKRLAHPEPAGVYWTRYYQLLLRGRDLAALQYLEQTYVRTRDVAALIDTVIAPALVEVGRGWQAGTLSIVDEHRISFLIRGHLLLLDNFTAMPPRPNRRALLACVNGEQHEMILQMLGIVLHHNGWAVDSLGINVPLAELKREIKKRPPKLLALTKTFSIVNSDAYLRAISTAARAQHISLCFGGSGWSMKSRKTPGARFIASMKEFETLLRSKNA